MKASSILLGSAVVLFVACSGSSGEKAFSLETPAGGYLGTVSEEEEQSVVSVSPSIRTDGKELVCKFSVVQHHGEESAPFQVSILNQEEGLAELRTTKALNYEEKNQYSLELEAVSCAGTYSNRIRVQIQVTDRNEFAPVWNADSLKVTIMEGEMVENLTTLRAMDKDTSPENGNICQYKIESENQPFEISTTGVLRNTRPLNFSESHSYVLSVVAVDCGLKKSAPILVVVEVLQPCNSGWSGLSSLINYVPSTGPQPLFPEASFNLCPEDHCQVDKVESTVFLETRHIGKGCDRDTYSLASQRRLCGASERAIDLLQQPAGLQQQQTSKTNKDDGSLSDKSITLFDGKSGQEVLSLLSSFPGETFTIATWLKHGQQQQEGEESDKHKKEHILCMADDHQKNRHHMSLFIRNCKLVLLLRRKYSTGEENVFRPAEWRWKLPQTCDNEWHHFAVSVKFPEVELFVDGDKWVEEKDNPEVIDDWPLHHVGGIDTKVTVGACWQGSEQGYKHELTGYLAGLWFLGGSNENSEVLRCLHQCAESLQIPAASSLSPGMELVSNSRGSKVVVDGPSAAGLTKLVQQVAYLNTREFPSPGRRLLTMSTTIMCKNDTKVLHLQDSKAVVNVVSVQEPTIQISGTKDIAREYDDFKLGVRIFADVHIVMTTGSPNNGEPVNGIENRLDECTVTVSPPLNSDHENVDVPEDLLRSLEISGRVSSQGATFSGAEMIYNYERLLRQVTYTNKKPAYYLNRQFKIVCSEMSRRFVSNEYSQTLNVIHPAASATDDVAAAAAAAHHDAKNAHRGLHELGVEEGGFKARPFIYSGEGGGRGHNNVVAIMAVVCVLFLAVLLVLGLVRIRASNKRAAAEELQAEVEMAWDDSSLNITVNPLEKVTVRKEGAMTAGPTGTLTENPCANDDYESDAYGEEEDEDLEEEEEEELRDSAAANTCAIKISNGGGGSSSSAGKTPLEWDNNI